MLGAIGSIVGGISGILGRKKKDPSPRDNLLSQAKGARQAAEQYGFNPLTMLQYGQTGGAMAGGGGAAPLASIQMLTEGLQGLDDIRSGDAARRRQADQLELDLAQIKLDQLRSGVVVTPPSCREEQIDPVLNAPSVFEVENNVTNGPISLPGADGDPAAHPSSNRFHINLCDIVVRRHYSRQQQPSAGEDIAGHQTTPPHEPTRMKPGRGAAVQSGAQWQGCLPEAAR